MKSAVAVIKAKLFLIKEGKKLIGISLTPPRCKMTSAVRNFFDEFPLALAKEEASIKMNGEEIVANSDKGEFRLKLTSEGAKVMDEFLNCKGKYKNHTLVIKKYEQPTLELQLTLKGKEGEGKKEKAVPGD